MRKVHHWELGIYKRLVLLICFWIIDWVSVYHQCGGWKIKIWSWAFEMVFPSCAQNNDRKQAFTPRTSTHSQLWWARGVASLSSHLCSVGPQAVALAPVVTSSSTAPSHWLLGHHRSTGGRGSKTAKAPPVGEVLVPGVVRREMSRQ